MISGGVYAMTHLQKVAIGNWRMSNCSGSSGVHTKPSGGRFQLSGRLCFSFKSYDMEMITSWYCLLFSAAKIRNISMLCNYFSDNLLWCE